MSDANDPSTPFARRPVQWGRPPQTTFRAGPLPRGTGLMPPVPTPQVGTATDQAIARATTASMSTPRR